MPAREVRQESKKVFEQTSAFRVEEHVQASYNLWGELIRYIQLKKPDLLVLEWPCDFEELQIPADGLHSPAL